jgi:hypothetical protein
MKGEKGAPRVGSLRLPSASRAARERQHVERSAHSPVEARARQPRFAGSGFGSSHTVSGQALGVEGEAGLLSLSVSTVPVGKGAVVSGSTVSQSRPDLWRKAPW